MQTQTETEVDRAETLANVIEGNEYYHTEEGYTLTVTGVEESVYGQIWIDTTARNFFEPEWWGLRQDGAIEEI
jgi:hypothetical protein